MEELFYFRAHNQFWDGPLVSMVMYECVLGSSVITTNGRGRQGATSVMGHMITWFMGVFRRGWLLWIWLTIWSPWEGWYITGSAGKYSTSSIEILDVGLLVSIER